MVLCKHSPQRAEVSGTASSGEKAVRCLSRFLLRMGMVLCKLSPQRAEKWEVQSTALYSEHMVCYVQLPPQRGEMSSDEQGALYTFFLKRDRDV